MKKRFENVDQAVAFLKKEGWELTDGTLTAKNKDARYGRQVLSILDYVRAHGIKVVR